MPASPWLSRSNLIDTIRTILAARGLSLAEVSRRSRTGFAGNPVFRIPPNFYDALSHVSFSPSLPQIYALSVLTRYRLADWLRLFDFSFDHSATFQASWPRRQTAELDAHIYNSSDEISWFKELQPASLGASLMPLSQWLSEKVPQPLNSLGATLAPAFRYLKIGCRDAYTFPDLLPGSIVRVDRRSPVEQLLEKYSGRIWALEHSRGIVCSRLRSVGRGRVLLCSSQLAYAPLELRLGSETRILGFVDLEIRRLAFREDPEVPPSAGQHWKPGAVKPEIPSGRVGEWLRQARIRSGLSFREASERTAEIARILRHPNYFCAASALSDFEASHFLPRHIHKVISLSVLYCVPVADLVGLAGLRMEDAGQEAMPDDWWPSQRRQPKQNFRPSPFLQAVEVEFEEIPFFLRHALPYLAGLPSLSVRDVFWAGATASLAHPYLRGAAFLVVNRRSKTPAPSLSSPEWAQPLYLLEMREGQRMCAACGLQNGTLVIRSCATTKGPLLRLRNRVDVEVLGKVVMIVRRLKG
jgi:hypothetical protein